MELKRRVSAFGTLSYPTNFPCQQEDGYLVEPLQVRFIKEAPKIGEIVSVDGKLGIKSIYGLPSCGLWGKVVICRKIGGKPNWELECGRIKAILKTRSLVW